QNTAYAVGVVVALILTPALCATMLKPIAKGDHGEGKKGFFGWFNRMFEKSTHHYTDSVGGILRSTGRYLEANSVDTVMGPLTWDEKGDLKGFEFG
ncbi:efflux RND transporter permease subunit, partial [Escherichia sp. R-CC3]